LIKRDKETFTRLADRTSPGFQKILERDLGRDLVDGIAFGRVVDILADGAYPTLHEGISCREGVGLCAQPWALAIAGFAASPW
jgi:hypothetical protein